MKKLVVLALLSIIFINCQTNKDFVKKSDTESGIVGDTVRIANDDLGYEIIVIDPGFNSWMMTNSRPRGYYSQPYLENRNRSWVLGWNDRARNPSTGAMHLMTIDYQNGINYGYEVNYLLYHYLTYFQIKNNIKLGGFMPRI